MDSKFRKKKEVKIIDNIICHDICCDEIYLLNEITKSTSIETPENIPEIIDENSANYTEKCPKKRGDIQYQCSLCDIQFTRKDNYDRHLFTQKHIREYFGPTDITKLRIQLLDEYGRPFNLNNADWSFVATFECFYN
jgi:uncharacterized C2H2 Zn-finger protein